MKGVSWLEEFERLADPGPPRRDFAVSRGTFAKAVGARRF